MTSHGVGVVGHGAIEICFEYLQKLASLQDQIKWDDGSHERGRSVRRVLSRACDPLRKVQPRTWSRYQGTSTQAYKSEMLKSCVGKEAEGDLLGLAASTCRGDFALHEIIVKDLRGTQRRMSQASRIMSVRAMRYPKTRAK